MGCGRQWCAGCGEELIHRDHRKAYESASALGQIVAREGPVNLIVTDLDMVAVKFLRNGDRLVRLIEQKQPEHQLRRSQAAALELLDTCIQHCIDCPAARDIRLDSRSGLILVRGHIAGSLYGRHETRFDGPQTIRHVRSRRAVTNELTVGTHEGFFRVLDPEDSTRRHGVGWKR